MIVRIYRRRIDFAEDTTKDCTAQIAHSVLASLRTTGYWISGEYHIDRRTSGLRDVLEMPMLAPMLLSGCALTDGIRK